MIFRRKRPTWKDCVLQELLNIHFHLDRLEAFYKMANNIKEDEKTGAWIEHKEHKEN